MESQNLLGLEDSAKLRFIQRTPALLQNDESSEGFKAILKKYEDVITGIRCLPKQHHIELKSDQTACVHPPQKVPLSLKGRLKKEWKMKTVKLITQQIGSTVWLWLKT